MSEIDRREALQAIGSIAVLPLQATRRTEPLVPQPKPGVEMHSHFYWPDRDEWFAMDVAQAYDTTFWDAPDWATDYELIDDVWCWV